MIREHEVGNLEKEYDHLFEIDANLDRLVRRIELLNYINPINIEKQKLRLERIADDRLRQLYQDVIYHYDNMIQCIETIGKGKNFYYNSLRVYGTPRERDVQNARFILHFADEPVSSDMEKVFSPEEAKSYFLDFSQQYDFPLQVRFSTHIAADAMVSNSSQTLVIKKNAKFSKNQL